MSRAAIRQFGSEEELTDFANELNAAGISPEIALMDSAGISALACLQAPGGDGWGFAYYAPNDEDGYIRGEEDSGHVRPRRYIGEGRQVEGWEPCWPVFGLVVAL